jgi:predicted MFS family arabinose efflux permease
VGALGAVTATAPAELLLDGLGWRGLFLALAAAVAAAAGAVWLLAPRDPPDGAWAGTEGAAATAAAARLGDVFRDHRFWRVAPVSACCVGTAFALQGLWAGPWLADVALLDRASVVRGLLAMALGLRAGALLLGAAADRLGRRGVRPAEVLAAAAAAAMAAQLALVLRAPVPPEALWALIGASGGATVLGFAALADIFPKASAGRANGALNLLHIGAAFLVQGGIGLVVGLWPADAFGRYPAEAYAAALGLNLMPQAAALAWFLLAPRLARAAGLGGAAWGARGGA